MNNDQLNLEQMKTIMTRVGNETRVIILGETEQSFENDSNNGLTYVVDCMKQKPDVGVIKIEKQNNQN